MATPQPVSPRDPDSDLESIDSLPDSAPSDDIDDTEDEDDAEREWRESLQQIELLLTMVLVPYLGKYFGRKMAYWSGCCISTNERRGMLTYSQVGRNI